MTKEMCECCGLREANNRRYCGSKTDTEGAPYADECFLECLDVVVFDERIRARRAKAEHPGDTIPAPPYFLAEPTGPREFKLAAPPPVPECRECSRPERPIAATHGDLCVYCAHKQDDGIFTDGVTEQRNAAARARLAAADRKAQPRATAESRMLALPHPWECDDV